MLPQVYPGSPGYPGIIFTRLPRGGFHRSSVHLRALPAQGRRRGPLVEGVGVAGECLVVGQRELHPAHDDVQSLGLGTAVLLVHQIGVVDYLGDLMKHGIVQLVLFKERLEGAVLPVVGEPGPHDVEELCTLRGFRWISDEGKGRIRIYEAPYQPYAGGAVHMAASACGPEHQLPPPEPMPSSGLALSLTASRAALSAEAASFLNGERK